MGSMVTPPLHGKHGLPDPTDWPGKHGTASKQLITEDQHVRRWAFILFFCFFVPEAQSRISQHVRHWAFVFLLVQHSRAKMPKM